MTVKLHSLASWKTLGPKQAIVLQGAESKERRIRISFNLERETALFISAEEGKAALLTTLPAGQNDVEFFAAGNLKVFAHENAGAIQYRTSEAEKSHFVVNDPVIFTKIAGRRERDPYMEELMYRANQNLEKRMAQMAAMMEQEYARRNAQDAARAVARASAANVSSQEPESGQPVQAPQSSPPSEPAGSTDGGLPNGVQPPVGGQV